MKTHKLSLRFVGMCAGLVLSACTVPDLKHPITEFADATKNTETALVALNEEVTAAYSEILKQQVLDRKRFIKSAEGECMTGSKRCRLITTDLDDNNEQYLKPDAALQKMIELMSAIRAYADGLAAIVGADTAGRVETQVNAAVGSVQNLSKTVKDLGGENKTSSVDLSEYATPAGQFVNWFIGQYVANIKLAGLKHATKNSKPVVAAAAHVFSDAARAASFIPKTELAAAIKVRKDALGDNLTEANLMKLIDSAKTYDQFLIAKPVGVFNGMVQAHNVLVDKLQGQNISSVVVISRIKEFAAEAETLSKVLKAFSDIGKDQKAEKGQ